VFEKAIAVLLFRKGENVPENKNDKRFQDFFHKMEEK
jgi:hypothetical protein